MIRFVSFGTSDFADPLRVTVASALAHGAGSAVGRTRDELVRTAFYQRNKAILDEAVGAGCWAWKPYFILEEMKAAADGDVVIHSDCGRPDQPFPIDRPLGILADWVALHRGGMLPGVYIPQWGLNREWTKGECFVAMGCDTPAIRDHPQIQATFSVWQKNERSMRFLTEWLDWCTKPIAISAERIDPTIPNAPDFKDHRHDQSVITNLALKQGLTCFGDPTEVWVGSNPGSKVDKRIGALVDRIEGRTWAIRSRIAAEDRRVLAELRPATGITAPLKRLKRRVTTMRDAIRAYP